MAALNFPSGFPEGAIIRGVPLMQAFPGRNFWVGNSATLPAGEQTAANTNDGESNRPLATIDHAIGLCAANRGDIIIVRPNHVETVIAAAGLAVDVAGIAFVGLGYGSSRPTINFTTAVTASMVVSAANCSMSNFLFTGGIDALTNPIHVQAADFSMVDCEYRDVTGQATDTILTTAAATRMFLQNYYHNGATVDGANSAVALVGTDGVVIKDFRCDGSFAVANIDFRTTASTDFELTNAFFRNRHATGLVVSDTVTGSTGRIGPNVHARQVPSGTGALAAGFTAGTMVWFDPVTVTDTANLRGLQIKAAASDA